MFGMPSTRIAELSRPDYHRELAEYARLEYPREAVRTVLLLALAAQEEAKARPSLLVRFARLLRPAPTPCETSPANG